MATSWIHVADLLDGELPDVCAVSGLPADATVPQDVAVLANDAPRRGRRFRLDLRMLWDHWVGGSWLDRGDRWTSWRLPHSWDAREQVESRAAVYVALLFPATASLAHGMAYGHTVTAAVGAVMTFLVIAAWTRIRAQRLRVMAFDGRRYLVSGLHPDFVRAMSERMPTGPPPPLGSDQLHRST